MIRRRIWRQGNSAVITLPPFHLEHLGLKVGQYIDLSLMEWPRPGDFLLFAGSPPAMAEAAHLKLVDNSVDKSVDK